MKKIVFLFFLLQSFTLYFAQKKISLKDFPNDKVMVVSHRADWRNAPENSIWAIRKAIEKGVDMVELDLAITKDSVLVLMHDKTINRTTTGTGAPSDYTLEEIKKFNLRDGLGVKTQMTIPTLEEVLAETKGKVLVNLDKGFNYIDLVYPMLKQKGMLDQVLFKGFETYKEFDEKYGTIKNDIHFMPIVNLYKGEGWEKITAYTDNYKVYGFEFTVGPTEEKIIDFSKLRKKNLHVWLNSLWPQENAGHNDDLALIDPNVYSWFLKNNINIIQTDRPLELIRYLKSVNKKYER